MCFSATASFTASAVLATIGLATLKNTGKSKAFALALIPMFFAIQQFMEGMQWLYLTSQGYPRGISSLAEFGFLFFAYLLWPIWIPFSLLLIETDQRRKAILKILLLLGFGVSCLTLYFWMANGGEAKVVNHSIQYGIPVQKLAIIPYIIAVTLPWFVTSFPRGWLFGSLVIISCIISLYLFSVVFTSVWCFFAAVLSIVLYFWVKNDVLPKVKS